MVGWGLTWVGVGSSSLASRSPGSQNSQASGLGLPDPLTGWGRGWGEGCWGVDEGGRQLCGRTVVPKMGACLQEWRREQGKLNFIVIPHLLGKTCTIKNQNHREIH